MLTSIEMPANFVPMTNAVLSEMARRGIARDQILATLRRMGGELPEASLQLLQWAARAGIDIRILSDCNSLFIGHILTGGSTSPQCIAWMSIHVSMSLRGDKDTGYTIRLMPF